ncbi:MAG: tetratricopeptide (TPR) repeat protein [Polaribacter sp.]|jgi:tetratricopeptide (TPR) repeat protein
MAIKRKKNKQQEETLVDIVEARDNAQGFLETNQMNIMGGLLALIVVVGGFLAYKHLYKTPREKQASSQLSQAQLQFEKDSFALALSNPGNGALGFEAIIESYGGTKAANIAKYYAGASYLHLGQYDAAIDYLQDFSPKGAVLAAPTQSMIGDAYAEKGDLASAAAYYKKALSAAKGNGFLSPMYLKKIGLLAEKNQDWKAAADAYNKIKSNFPTSIDGSDIDKFIARVGTKQ